MDSFEQNFINNLKFDNNELIPAIVQDWIDGTILMFAWMNRTSLRKTLSSKEVHYWSRSRKEIWRKGATSGNTQKLKEIRYDCDKDVLLITIEQKGGACHKGYRSCFFNKFNFDEQICKEDFEPPSNVCNELFRTIQQRHKNNIEGSYTKKLFDEGDNLILKKIGEESAEFIMACKDKNKKDIKNEAADIIYHMQVALEHNNVSWNEVLLALQSRKGKRRKT